ncbi:hypothetical protein GCM10023192_64590 [Amycolatopsis samaneae]
MLDLIAEIVDNRGRTLRALLLGSVLLTILLAGVVLSARSVLAGVGAVPTAALSVLLTTAMRRQRATRAPVPGRR